MNSTSPANSSMSTTAIVGGGGVGNNGNNNGISIDDFHFLSDLSVQDRKDETMLVLKTDLMAALNKEVKSLDEDNWMFEGPRSRINLISRADISSMESQPLIKFHHYHYVAVLLMLLAGVRFEVGRCESISDPKDSNVNVSYDFKNYLMTSYFDKHEVLLDSAFQDFIAHEVRPGLCEGLPDNLNLFIRQSVLQRHLIGEGSHRRLASSIEFHIDEESSSRLPIKSCEVLIIERLPSGVFADPFELQHLHQRGVFTDIAVFGDTNLELPSFLSNRSAVEIHLNISSIILQNQENRLEIKVELPLHARYPPLNDSGYSIVEFGDPDLFMDCSIEGKPQHQNCLFMPTSIRDESKTNPAVWIIPAGIEAHYKLVSLITFCTALLATRSVLFEAIFPNGLL